MNSYLEIKDVAAETVIVLEHLNNDILKEIPDKFMKPLKDLAQKSKHNIQIDINKSLEEQNISEQTKDLIALVYYMYIANQNEKKEIIDLWNKNDIEYKMALKEKYNLENMFKSEIEEKQELKNDDVCLVKKESILKKIIYRIKRIMHINN